MSDLRDGESVEMQGSGSRPYVLKNVGGVYSCTCPAWRNQSIGIERRTCKHLRKLRGDAPKKPASAAPCPSNPSETNGEVSAPPVLLAETWDGVTDPTGWWLSEKLDGVRATGTANNSSPARQLFHAPDWFVAGLPDVPWTANCGWAARSSSARSASCAARTK